MSEPRSDPRDAEAEALTAWPCPLCGLRRQDPDGNRWATAHDSGTLCTECTTFAKEHKQRRSVGL